MGDYEGMPSGNDQDDRAWCSVADAAPLLGGCSKQTVRNLLTRGELKGERVVQGRRTNVWRVDVRSIEQYLARNGSPTRDRPAVTIGDRLDEVELRLRRLEALPGGSPTASRDLVNLQFANLRLLQIQEGYDRALGLLLSADEQRRAVQDALVTIAAEYRAVVEQFHLPGSPPDSQ